MSNHQTTVSIEGNKFFVDGRPTYEGRWFGEWEIEGLLLLSRMVNGIFDDRNSETRGAWAYPDGPWDPERNTREFVAAMPEWRMHGLLSFTINLQGGNPRGYSANQPWETGAIDPDGSLRPEYLERLARILDRADELGMVPMLGLFYFGQDHRIRDEQAVRAAVVNTVDWLVQKGYRHVLVETANEVDIPRYTHDIIRVDRCQELIELVKTRSQGRVATPAHRLLVSTSFGGGTIPPDSIVSISDFILLHGNRQDHPDLIRRMVDAVRQHASYRGQPVLFNEDDHFEFDKEDNNMLAAISRYAGWGFFDFRYPGEKFEDGYQSIPVDWGIHSERKKAFFELVAKVVGQ
jgi:hypothetical protein